MGEQNERVKSIYEGEQGYEFEKEYKKLGKKITDVVIHKITGIKTTIAISACRRIIRIGILIRTTPTPYETIFITGKHNRTIG